MKTIISAIALLIAAPAFAQAAPAADPHAGHAQHQGMDHSKMDHSKMDHGKMGHGDCCKDGAKDCCEKARKAGKSMPCCEKAKAAKAPAAPATGHEGHAGHDH